MSEQHAVDLMFMYSGSGASEHALGHLRRVSEAHGLEAAVLADAEARQRSGKDVSLEWVLTVWPDIVDDPVALDAAIESVLRARALSPAQLDSAADELCRSFPEFADQIGAAALLTKLFWSAAETEIAASATPFLAPGTAFGESDGEGVARYEIIDRLGAGASGEVYEARDRWFATGAGDGTVAIKVLHAEAVDHTSLAAQEALLARRIRHDNVIRIFDRGLMNDGRPFIVMEKLSGSDLTAFVPASRRALAAFFSRLCAGVHAIHQTGTVHCDLKPENVLLRKNDDGQTVPVVSDFSVAIPSSGTQRLVALTFWSPRGTPEFAAPELLDPGATVTTAADQFSIGAMLKRAASDAGLLDDRLQLIVGRCMNPEPAQRFRSVPEIADALTCWARGAAIPQIGEGALHAALRLPRSRPVSTAIGAAILVLAGGVTVLGYGALVNARVERAIQDRFGQVWTGERLSGLHLRDWVGVSRAMEVVAGELDPDTPLSGFADREESIERVQAFIDARAELGEPESLESATWKLALLTMHLSTRTDHPNTGSLLDEAQAYFLPRLDPADPVATDIAALAAVHEVRTRRLHLDDRPITDADRRVLVQSVETLQAFLVSRGVEVGRTPEPSLVRDRVVQLAIRGVWQAAIPRMLDRPRLHEAMQPWADVALRR